MKGLELAEKYYHAFGESMIREQFPEWEGQIAAGLTGSGSECYGYDDGVSADHDFEPGFCLFLPGEGQLDRRTAFQLERAYAKLPAAFEGYARQKMAPTGGQRHGVFRREEFFRDKLGCLPEEMTAQDWLRLPDWALAEAVNGKIFRDDAGEMTRAREILPFLTAIKPNRLEAEALTGEKNVEKAAAALLSAFGALSPFGALSAFLPPQPVRQSASTRNVLMMIAQNLFILFSFPYTVLF